MGSPYLVPLVGISGEFTPETSCAPEVRYGPATVAFVNRDERFVRASFDRWDALRVCRGEHLPVAFEPTSATAPGCWPAFFVVQDSSWIQERYAYEKKHYARAYEFGNSVEEMLTDFEHYVLQFHDEFVEVIAGGIWFEMSDVPLPADKWQRDHPKLGLGSEHVVESFTYRGVPCEVRRSPYPLAVLMERALLCAQPAMAFALRIGDDAPRVAFTLSIREHRGRMVCIWRDSLGAEKRRFNAMPNIDEMRASFVEYVDEVLARRRERGL